jgi:hypothetical protein
VNERHGHLVIAIICGGHDDREVHPPGDNERPKSGYSEQFLYDVRADQNQDRPQADVQRPRGHDEEENRGDHTSIILAQKTAPLQFGHADVPRPLRSRAARAIPTGG